MVMNLHQATHLGDTKTFQLLKPKYVPNLESLIKDITFKCATCAQVNPKREGRAHKGPGLKEMGLGNTGSCALLKSELLVLAVHIC